MFTELLSSIRWNSRPCWKCYLHESPGSSTFPASDGYIFLAEPFIHTRGMCWHSLAGFRGSLWKTHKKLLQENVSETSPFPQICACAWPRTCFELHLQCLLTECILKQTVSSCCSNVMDVTLQENTKVPSCVLLSFIREESWMVAPVWLNT